MAYSASNAAICSSSVSFSSNIAIANELGIAERRYRFDPFGQQREIATGFLAATAVKGYLPVTQRGYTGHEMLPNLDVIHMNGRIYDPTIARFLQADPMVQAPTNLQNLNRYSYVLNNPMSYTDPSGYFFKSLANFVQKHWRSIAGVAISVLSYGAMSQYAASMGFVQTVQIGTFQAVGQTWAMTMTTLSLGGKVLAGALTGALSGLVSGGSLSSMLNGALSGGVYGGLGYGHHDLGWTVGKQVTSHALAGGVLSVIQGGKFGNGFLTAGFSKMFGKASRQYGKLGGTLMQAVAGGTVSRLTGGKFSNAVTSTAIQFTVNEMSFGAFDIFRKGDEVKLLVESVEKEVELLVESVEKEVKTVGEQVIRPISDAVKGSAGYSVEVSAGFVYAAKIKLTFGLNGSTTLYVGGGLGMGLYAHADVGVSGKVLDNYHSDQETVEGITIDASIGASATGVLPVVSPTANLGGVFSNKGVDLSGSVGAGWGASGVATVGYSWKLK